MGTGIGDLGSRLGRSVTLDKSLSFFEPLVFSLLNRGGSGISLMVLL